jgi:hypothetical protein
MNVQNGAGAAHKGKSQLTTSTYHKILNEIDTPIKVFTVKVKNKHGRLDNDHSTKVR